MKPTQFSCACLARARAYFRGGLAFDKIPRSDRVSTGATKGVGTGVPGNLGRRSQGRRLFEDLLVSIFDPLHGYVNCGPLVHVHWCGMHSSSFKLSRSHGLHNVQLKGRAGGNDTTARMDEDVTKLVAMLRGLPVLTSDGGGTGFFAADNSMSQSGSQTCQSEHSLTAITCHEPLTCHRCPSRNIFRQVLC